MADSVVAAWIVVIWVTGSFLSEVGLVSETGEVGACLFIGLSFLDDDGECLSEYVL